MSDERIIQCQLNSLDTSGNISITVNGSTDIGGSGNVQVTTIPFAICNTNSSTPDKIAESDSSFTLTIGSIVVVKFYSTNTADNMRLNVNSTGLKSVYYHGNQIEKNILKAGIYIFVYNGTYYELIGDLNNEELFKGATSNQSGTAGLVPAPQQGDDDKFLKSDGTWASIENNVGGNYWLSID